MISLLVRGSSELRVDAPVDAREERAIDATSAEEHDDIVLAACEERHRVHDGIEHVGRVVEGKVRRHGSLSTSRARSSTRRGRHVSAVTGLTHSVTRSLGPGPLWGSRTRSPMLTWASMQLARIR
jgi:hypothetical protein